MSAFLIAEFASISYLFEAISDVSGIVVAALVAATTFCILISQDLKLLI